MNETGLSGDLDEGDRVPRGRFFRIVRYSLRIVGIMILAVVGAFFGGFLIFYQHVASLSLPEHPKAEGIVALTGGYKRIDRAVELLGEGAGSRLLISGVHPSTTGNQIRLLTRSSSSMFDCCVDIGHEATDTAGNATETAHWIKEQGFHRVILVTNNYHMPRSLAELRRANPDITFVAYPVPTPVAPADIVRNPLVLRVIASEYVKYLLVQARDWVDIPV